LLFISGALAQVQPGSREHCNILPQPDRRGKRNLNLDHAR
jgi:hypothetical protein